MKLPTKITPTCITSRLSGAYRLRQFRRAAALRAWPLGALLALSLVINVLIGLPPSGWHLAQRISGVLIALGYWWLEIHYGAVRLALRQDLFLARRRRWK